MNTADEMKMRMDFDDPRKVLPRGTDPALAKRIYYENAAEVYGLPPIKEAQQALEARTAAAV